MDDDTRHLDLLSTFHFVFAGVVAVFGCFPIIHLVVGLLMLAGKLDGSPNGPPDWFGAFFVLAAIVMIGMMWSLAIVAALTGYWLKQRRGYQFCFVVAALECTFVPLGTVLGVFTILVLSRPSVKRLFGVAPPTDASTPRMPPLA